MKSALESTAILGFSSMVSIVAGLATSKLLALWVGPSGLGVLMLLQTTVGLVALPAGLGLAAGLVRSGAEAVSRHDDHTLRTLFRAAAWLIAASGATAAVGLVLFRSWVSTWIPGSASDSSLVPALAVALLFSLAGSLQNAWLNAHHRVRTLARSAIVAALLGGASSIGLVWILGMRGIVWSLIVAAAIGWAVPRYFVGREIGRLPHAQACGEIGKAAGKLLRFGIPYAGSMMVGAGMQLALPLVIVRSLGAEGVGYYRAASAIAVNSLAFLLAAMAQDYFPRVSAAASDTRCLVALANEQQRIVILVALPVVITVVVAAPVIVPLLYSSDFLPSSDLLQWLLIADLFKFSSWTLSYLILARCKSSIYFLLEALAGATLLVATTFGVRWFGVTGVGIGYLACYVVYYLAVWAVARSEIGFAWTWPNRGLMLAAIAAVLILRILSLTSRQSWVALVGLLFIVATMLLSARLTWTEFRRWKEPAVGSESLRSSPVS